jgi:hypothetical protein
MARVRKTEKGIASPFVRYTGDAFAPASETYVCVDMRNFNFTTLADSGYAPSAIGRISDLGAIAPLALAALWEAAFAFEAGPISTWRN